MDKDRERRCARIKVSMKHRLRGRGSVPALAASVTPAKSSKVVTSDKSLSGEAFERIIAQNSLSKIYERLKVSKYSYAQYSVNSRYIYTTIYLHIFEIFFRAR